MTAWGHGSRVMGQGLRKGEPEIDEVAIKAVGLTKVFGDAVAVDHIDLDVKKGELFGLVGPDGAGKTSMMRLLVGIMEPTSGEAWVAGLSVMAERERVKERIGYMSQRFGLYEDLTVIENIHFYADLYGVSRRERLQSTERLLGFSNLTPFQKRFAGQLSGGMKQKLGLACALVHRPEVLFLDEPTTGLDPQNRAGLWKYLERLNKDDGLTIFLTTHYMEEADRLCNRLAIIDHGRIIAEGSPAALKAELGGDVIALVFMENGMPPDEQKERATAAIKQLAFVREVSPADGGVQVIVQDGGAAVPQVLALLGEAGLTVARLSLTSPTLDDVFLKHTGRLIRQEDLNTNWRSARGGWGPWGGRRRK